MSYQEKRTIVSIISGMMVLAAYCIYVFGRYQSGNIDPNDWKFFAASILIFIGIGIAVAIAIQIIFHIMIAISIAVKERERDDKEISKMVENTIVEDEMDKLIELKSMRISFAIAGVGFITAMVSLVLGSPAVVMLNILFLSCFVGGLTEGILSLYYYRKGVRNV